MLARMKLRLPHIRKLARFFAGVFAVQVIAAGACLMVPAAHAMPMPAKASVMSHCDGMEMGNAMVMEHAKPMSHDHAGHSACPHCDQPDSMSVSYLSIDHAPVALAMLPVDTNLSATVVDEAALAVRVPTGPPRSASLIFQTTRRIRI